MKKFILLFLIFPLVSVGQDCETNLQLSVDAGNTQGFCAPIEIDFPVTFPSENYETTEYIFIIHDVEEPYTYTDTLSYFHGNTPNEISFFFPTSSCNATGLGYQIDYYIKDTSCEGILNTELGYKVGSASNIIVGGPPEAAFASALTSCSTYTFTNTSLSGQQVENFTCTDSPASVNWIIDADPSEYQVLEGSLGEGLTGSHEVVIQFNPGNYQTTIIASSDCASDTLTQSICVQDYNIDINDLNFNFPDTVCVNETITLENDISSIVFCNPNNPWFSWQINPIAVACEYEEDHLIFYEPLSSTSPSFSVSNSGTYEMQFTTTDPCIIPAIDTTHTITVKGIPQIDTLIYDQICNTLSAELTVDFDSCVSEAPYTNTWAITSDGSAIFSDNPEVNLNTVSFEDAGNYVLQYTLNSSCGSDSANFDLFISDLLDLGNPSDSVNFCDTEAYIVLAPETYLNNDSTNYTIQVFQGENNLIHSWIYSQAELPQGNLPLSGINSSSCDLTYENPNFNGSYKVELKAFNECDSSLTRYIKVNYTESEIDANCSCNEIFGCTDSSATNFNNLATEDDGSCTYNGCTYEDALNYDEEATEDDGSCIFEVNVTFENVTNVTNIVSIYNINTVNIVLGTEVIAIGDLLGAFYLVDSVLVSAGYIVYDGNVSAEIALIGDDPATENIEGFQEGQEIIWIVQQVETEINYLINVNIESVNFIVNIDIDVIFEQVDPIITLGCTDSLFCNYNPNANIEDGSCKDPEEYFDCNGSCINDSDMDGICDELEIDGCTYEDALNYDEEATEDDGSCIFEVNVTFENVTNVTNIVSIYNINTVNIVLGTEVIAIGDLLGAFYLVDGVLVSAGYIVYDGNVSAEIALIGDDPATENIEGFQEGQEIIWIVQQVETEINYLINVNIESLNFVVNIDVDVIFEQVDPTITLGCTDSLFCNYNPNANIEDGSCKDPEEYFDCNGSCINDSDMDGICDELEIDGCTDLSATNFNSLATEDDGSCTYSGCTYEDALNYNEETDVDDGSCIYEYNVTFENVTNVTNIVSIYNINTVNIVLGTEVIAIGDLLGAFYLVDGILVSAGYIVYDGNVSAEIALIGDDPATENIEGFQEGQEIIWIVQQVETEINYLINVNIESVNFVINLEVDVIFEQVDPTITLGCTDLTACNYNEYANLDDGSCKYSETYLDCNGNCINDSDMDAVCDETDNCIDDMNPDQIDSDNDGQGDACDYDDGIGIDEADSARPVLIKMIDVLGRTQLEHKEGTLLFYVYDNGIVDKKLR